MAMDPFTTEVAGYEITWFPDSNFVNCKPKVGKPYSFGAGFLNHVPTRDPVNLQSVTLILKSLHLFSQSQVDQLFDWILKCKKQVAESAQ